MSKTDLQLKQQIEDELRWDPKVNSAQIGVSVDGGAVSLLGTVDTYAEKWAAEAATRRVGGVRSVAHDLAVKIGTMHAHSDTDIAAAVQSALRWDVFVPRGITATVEHGVVALGGHCTWNYQREAAERAVSNLRGVTGIRDSVSIRPHVSDAVVKENIGAALQRQAMADTRSILVDTSGGKVTLSGQASSWTSVQDAKAAAWAAPGVTEVVDDVRLSISV